MPATQEMTPRMDGERLAGLSRRVYAIAREPVTHAEIEAVAADAAKDIVVFDFGVKVLNFKHRWENPIVGSKCTQKSRFAGAGNL